MTRTLSVPLNELMAFDHVIQVHADGSISEPLDVYAPDFECDTDFDGQILRDHERVMLDDLRGQGWELMNGYSGQHSYSGPGMHRSEYIGGGLERDILSEPGIYVAVEIRTSDGLDPDSWAVARKI